jgi:very-short-patch-repair endonuclease
MTLFAGHRVGLWTLMEPIDISKNNIARRWLCRCDCGTEREVVRGNLLKQVSRSCGCLGLQSKYPRIPSCIGCGKEFPSNHPPGRRYCSHDCYIKNGLYRARPGTCVICGAKTRREKHRHCSPKCIGESKKRKWIKGLKCARCGKEIPPTRPSEKKRHCSSFCAVRNKPPRRGIFKTCVVCEKDFYRPPSVKAKTGACSRECAQKTETWKNIMRVKNATARATLETNIERIGYLILGRVGVSFFRQHLLFGKFCVDSYLEDCALVIQFDGDYWHGNPSMFPKPNAMQKKNMQRDVSQDAYMRKCGLTVLRFWECDIEKRPDWVESQIRDWIKANRPSDIPETAEMVGGLWQ